MIDGMIELDTPFAKELGFTSDLFYGYLWKFKNDIFLSLISSLDEGKGNLSRLINRIHELGYTIKVPVPLGKMRSILERKGFRRTIQEHDIIDDNLDIWVKEPPAQT